MPMAVRVAWWGLLALRAADASTYSYRHLIGANCYSGHGGTDIDVDPVVGLTAAQCTARCDTDAACNCVTYRADIKDCWKRAACVENEFMRGPEEAPYDVYIKGGWKEEPGSIGCASSCPDPSCVCLAGNATRGCLGSASEQCYWGSAADAEKYCAAWDACVGFHIMPIASGKWYASGSCGLQCLQGPTSDGWRRWVKSAGPPPPAPTPPPAPAPAPAESGTGISVSGFSSGACMSQLQFLHWAGQADGLGYNGCVNFGGGSWLPAPVKAKLRGKGVFVSSGTQDQSHQKVVDSAGSWGDVVGTDRLKTLFSVPTGHCWPSAALDRTSPCSTSKPIQNCNDVDTAGLVLQNAYNDTLKKPPNMHDTSGSMYWLAQAPYVPGGDTGAADVWSKAAVFKPPQCVTDASRCMVHVHYHGCGMRPGSGWNVERNSGFNQWGLANGIVVIYPSADDCWMTKADCWDSNPGADEKVCQLQLNMVQGMIADVRANKAKLAPM